MDTLDGMVEVEKEEKEVVGEEEQQQEDEGSTCGESSLSRNCPKKDKTETFG